MSEVVQDTRTFTIALDYAVVTFSIEVLNQTELETVGIREGQNAEVKLRITNTGTEDIEICSAIYEGAGVNGALLDRSPEGCSEGNPLIPWPNIGAGTYIDRSVWAKNMPANSRTVTVQVKAKPKGWW